MWLQISFHYHCTVVDKREWTPSFIYMKYKKKYNIMKWWLWTLNNFDSFYQIKISIYFSKNNLHHNSSKYSPNIKDQIGWKSSWKDQIFCWVTMFSDWYPIIEIIRKYLFYGFYHLKGTKAISSETIFKPNFQPT